LLRGRVISISLIFFYLLFIHSEVLCQSSSQQSKEFEKLVLEAKALLADGEYEKALIRFLEAEKIAISKPEQAEIYFRLSYAYYVNGQNDRARVMLTKLLEMSPEFSILEDEYPKGYVELFNQFKDEVIKRIEKEKILPKAISTPGKAEKIKKKRQFPWLIAGGVVVAAVTASLFLFKKEKASTPAPQPPPVEPQNFGTISVLSSPTGARVYLDGSDTGKITNCMLDDVSVGTHTVKLSKEGYVDQEKTVTVEGGKTITVEMTLSQYKITVTSPLANTSWKKETEVEIKWNTSAAFNIQKKIYLSPGDFPTGLSNSSVPLAKGEELSSSSIIDNLAPRDHWGGILFGKTQAKLPVNKPSGLQPWPKKSDRVNTNKGVSRISNRNEMTIIENYTEILDAGRFLLRNNSKPFSSLKRLINLGLTKVKIDLYKGNNWLQTIAPNAENSGAYKWIIPTILSEATDYKIRISSPEASEVFGESEKFRIYEIDIVFSDDFESYVAGTFPSGGGWKLITDGWGSSSQMIDNSNSVSGTKSFKLEGAANWAAVVQKNYSMPNPQPDVIYYECYAKVTRLESPVMWYHDFQIWAGEFGSPTGSHAFASVSFNPKQADGKEYILFKAETVWGAEVQLGKWYKIKVKIDLVKDLGYVWLDDQIAFSDVALGSSSTYHIGSAITIAGGNDCHTRIWVDDVKVYY